jgi:hypothetical protein
MRVDDAAIWHAGMRIEDTTDDALCADGLRWRARNGGARCALKLLLTRIRDDAMRAEVIIGLLPPIDLRVRQLNFASFAGTD